MLTTRSMPGGEGVAAGQTATFRLPIGLTFLQLLLTYSGVTLAQMTELRVVANGKVIQRYSGADELDSINQFEGRAAAAGIIVLDFARYNIRTRGNEEVTAIGTGLQRGNQLPDPAKGILGQDPNPLTTLAVEIDISAAAAAPVLSMKAVQDIPSRLDLFKKVRRFIYTAGASGDFEIADLPKGDIINKIMFGNHAANVYTKVTLVRDNFIMFERSTAENELMQSDGVRTPQADYVVMDPTENGHGSEGVATAGVNDLRFRLNLTNAGQVPVLLETIGPLEG